ncbi:BMP family ABC transporter substrate-binding protein [Pseudomonas batumici]|uniref:Bmp family protein n=1 Tax=Pseudomonas batumici TaxID=226910 RepID=A0A0C2I114_9PSED|nr:BMP family ABC transporter substrate-binding protein [Pseudomonas batumici]KIH82991.1 Bmp family protein [Pseudomonas batumici]
MSTGNFDRRTFLQLMAASGVMAYGITNNLAFGSDTPLTVGILYSGSKQDYGYNQSHALAAAELKKIPGIKVVEEERVPETIAAQRSMEGMIRQDGAKLIIATSFGFFKPHVLEMAKKFPEVTFAHTGGLWTEGMPDNVGTFYGHIFAAQYLCGIVAGHMTKSKKLGVVAAKPTPNLVRSINAFTIAARSVDPAITVNVIFTGDWVLPVREAESANSLVDQGVDVIACSIDSPKVVIETAEKRGAMSIGYHSSQADVGPKGFLTGAQWHWIVPYLQFVAGVQEGRSPAHVLRGGLAEGFVINTPFGSAVSAEAKSAFETARAELIAGTRVIYSGPLKDNKGNLVIPEGTAYKDSDRALDPINYLVEGVVGEI